MPMVIVSFSWAMTGLSPGAAASMQIASNTSNGRRDRDIVRWPPTEFSRALCDYTRSARYLIRHAALSYRAGDDLSAAYADDKEAAPWGPASEIHCER
ncbi:MAG: hypothetical protein Kow00106_08440 [Anaerolineae bacterium]